MLDKNEEENNYEDDNEEEQHTYDRFQQRNNEPKSNSRHEDMDHKRNLVTESGGGESIANIEDGGAAGAPANDMEAVIDEEEMLDIAEKCFMRIAENIINKKMSVREAFKK